MSRRLRVKVASLCSLALCCVGACGGEQSGLVVHRNDDFPDAAQISTAGVCTPTRFHLDVGIGAGATHYCVDAEKCPEKPRPEVQSHDQWLTIVGPDGDIIVGSLGVCIRECSTCSSPNCHSGFCLNPPIQPSGLDNDWSGESRLSGTCGDGAYCTSHACAAPGRYTARMCVHALPPGDVGDEADCGDRPALAPTCVEVPFDYPTSEPVVGAL